MGEVNEQRYVCKICNKSCVSGKSLGGHMRVHSALISASKRMEKEKSEFEIPSEERNDDQESFKNQSNSDEVEEEEEEEVEIGDGDQSSSYGLRENPRKSWRVSDPKHGGLSKNTASCKECSKDFPSLRALSGHMRSHSSKNKKAHKCKKCGKGFDSMRAMFGHMKTHSVRSKARDDCNGESLSDLDDLCPIRRKRSRIRYKAAPCPSLSELNASTSAVSELEDVEEAAKCLMMLSRGETGWVKFDLTAESSDDDDSVYFGANSYCKSKNSIGDDKMKASLSPGSVDDCVSDSANKTVPEFDDDGHEMKVDLEDHHFDKLVECRKVDERGLRLDCVDSRSSCKDRFGPTGRDGASIALVASNSCKKESFSGDESSLERNSFDNESGSHEIVKDSMVKKRGRSDRVLDSMETNTVQLSVAIADSKLDCSGNIVEQARAGTTSSVSACSSKSKERECPICFRVFTSGQALGGHKRAHYNGSYESKSKESTAVKQVAEVRNLLDLNYPVAATVEEDAKSDGELNLWWPDRTREHEPLVLTQPHSILVPLK